MVNGGAPGGGEAETARKALEELDARILLKPLDDVGEATSLRSRKAVCSVQGACIRNGDKHLEAGAPAED